MPKILPNSIIFTLCILTTVLWILSKPSLGQIGEQPLRSASQLAALIGSVLLSLTLLMSTRIKIIERLYKGLDKVYQNHHLVGALSFILLISHPLLLALQSFKFPGSALQYLLPGSSFAYNLGIFSLYTMILGFIFLVFIKLPYHLWKISHQIMGLSVLFATLHSMLILSDISHYLPLRLWILIFMLIGIFSALYKIFFYDSLAPHLKYKVTKIERLLDILNLYLTPRDKPLRFHPGQFVYAKFKNKTVGNEPHPFSISSSPHDSLLRLSIKILGDYTLRLPYLVEGDTATLYGPYGTFAGHHHGRSLWVGGGIGISPFLSMIPYEKDIKSYDHIDLIYLFRKPEEGVFLNEIKEVVKRTNHIQFIPWCSSEEGRCSIKVLKLSPLLDYDSFFLCGPKEMMADFSKQLTNEGVSKNKIHFENFDLL